MLEIRFSIDTGEGRFSAGRANAFIQELKKFQKSSPVFISYEHPAALSLQAGKTKEGLSALRALISEQPHYAPHHERLASALLGLGLGAAAKAAAQRAVEVAPRRAEAHALLGWTLLHDDLGRFLHVGMDRVRAEKALQTAQQLKPQNPRTFAQLGLLYLHGSLGGALGSDANLPLAIQNLEHFQEATGSETFNHTLARALFRLRLYAKAKAYLKPEKAGVLSSLSTENAALLLAIESAQNGSSSALKWISSLGTSATERVKILYGAAKELPALRLYSQAAQLMQAAILELNAGAQKDEFQMQFLQLSRTQQATRCFHSKEDPRSWAEKKIYKMLSKRAFEKARRKRLAGTLFKDAPHSAQARSQRFLAFADEEGLVLSFVRDTTVCHASFISRTLELNHGPSKTKNTTRDRLTQLLPRENIFGSREAWWVVEARGEVKVFPPGLETDRKIAEFALAALDENKLKVASFWLRNIPAPPLSMQVNAREQLQLSALWLLQMSAKKDAKNRRADEREAFSKRTLSAAGQAWLAQEKSLFSAEKEGAFKKNAPFLGTNFREKTNTLLQKGDFDEVERLAQHRLGEHIGDSIAVEQLANVSLQRGDIAAGQALLQRLSRRNLQDPTPLNTLAWSRLFMPSKGSYDDAIAHALMANALSDFSSAEHLLTLATLFAESGRSKEALSVLAKSVDARSRAKLSAKEQYVVGRVAERLGLDEIAKKAYLQVQKPVKHNELSAWSLAQHRLNALRLCVSCIDLEEKQP